MRDQRKRERDEYRSVIALQVAILLILAVTLLVAASR